jgi:hypothetical protein
VAGFRGWGGSEQPIEPTVEIGAVLGQRAVLEFGAAPPNTNRALQELVEAGSKAGVAPVDGELCIAQQVSVMPTSA